MWLGPNFLRFGFVIETQLMQFKLLNDIQHLTPGNLFAIIFTTLNSE